MGVKPMSIKILHPAATLDPPSLLHHVYCLSAFNYLTVETYKQPGKVTTIIYQINHKLIHVNYPILSMVPIKYICI